MLISLDAYREATRNDRISRLAYALGDGMFGSFVLAATPHETKDLADYRDRAIAALINTGSLAPYNSDAGNLQAIGEIFQCCHQETLNRAAAQHAADQLLRALAVGPTNQMVLKNLEQFYHLLDAFAGQSSPPFTKDEIQQRLVALKGYQNKIVSYP